MSYKETYPIRSYEADFKNTVKISSIFNYMQESASVHAANLGFGYEQMQKAELFWVLSRAKIIMKDYVKAGESIIVETWPKGISKLFALRDFRLYDANHREIGIATTSWLVMSKKTLRPVRPEIVLENIPTFEIAPAIPEVLEKITETEVLSPVKEITTGYNDIDINQHVNNVKYIEFVLDSFPEKLFLEKKIGSL